MKTTKILPVVLISITALVTGVTIAAAQDKTTSTAAGTPTSDANAATGDVRRGYRAGQGSGGRHSRGFGKRGGYLMQVFKEADANRDGSLTQQELDTYRNARVAGVDASGDGALSIDEFDTLYRELTRPRMVNAFQDLDKNGDGTISSEELDARFGSIVQRMDRDGDGAVSLKDRGHNRRGGNE